MQRGEVEFALALGGNLYGSNPDARFARSAMNKLDMMVYLSTTLNTGHASGLGRETIILPVLARDEEPQSTTQESMFNFVRLSDGGVARHQGPRSEVSVIAELAERVLGNSTPINWQSMQQHHSIREAIAQIVPGYEQVKEIGETKKSFIFPADSSKRRAFQPRMVEPSLPAIRSPS